MKTTDASYRPQRALVVRLTTVLLFSVAATTGCSSKSSPGEPSQTIRISEYSTCQGDVSRLSTGSAIVATNVAVGTLLAGQSASSSILLSANFLTEPGTRLPRVGYAGK